MLNSKELETLGLKPCYGWYQTERIDTILDEIIKIDNRLRENKITDYYCEASLDPVTIIHLYKENGVYRCEIIIKATIEILIGEGSGNYYEAIASAVMKMHGYEGIYTPTKIHMIKESMEKLNLEYSDSLNEQWD